jgi:hypothetical protein
LSRLRRHPITTLLALLVLGGAVVPLPSLLDAVTGATPADIELVRPLAYLVVAPLSTVLDALTFLAIDRVPWALGVWTAVLAAWAVWRPGSPWARLRRAALAPLLVALVVAATVVLPRPVPRLVTTARSVAVIDYHAHTESSHDGRPRWTVDHLARWHARQGFHASYVTDHNRVFPGATGVIALLPGAEWSVHRQHVLALGQPVEVDRERFQRATTRMLGMFAELDREGALAIAALPEYWRNHWDALDDFVAAGVDGFELVNCSPKAIGFPAADRARVIALARRHDLLLVGATDNHGWGAVTCVWNLAVPGASGVWGNRVIARPLALVQSATPAWTAAATYPWLMFRALTWNERVSWLTWIAVVTLYGAVPRRSGQTGGFAILARSLKLRALLRRRDERD